MSELRTKALKKKMNFIPKAVGTIKGLIHGRGLIPIRRQRHILAQEKNYQNKLEAERIWKNEYE